MSGTGEDSPETAEKQLTIRRRHAKQPAPRVQSGRRPIDRNLVIKRKRQLHKGHSSRAREDDEDAAEGPPREVELYNPQTMLDRGSDPFSALPCAGDLPDTLVSEIAPWVTHALTNLIPDGAQGPDGTKGHSFSGSLWKLAVHDKALLYSMLSAGAVFHRIRGGAGEKKSAVELHIARTAVTALQQQISNPSQAATVANIWSSAPLALYNEIQPVRMGKLPRQSSLKELQSLQVYGRTLSEKGIYRGFMRLIQMAGGLQKVNNHGVASSLSYVTLVSSTANWQRHHLPFIPYSATHLDETGRFAVTQDERIYTRSILGEIGTSFSKVWSGEEGRPISDLLIAIQHMGDFTIIVENYIQGRPSERQSAVLNDQRNHAHHAIMSLYSAQEFTKVTGNLCDELYDPCRLACVAYSFLVIFPVPPTALFKKVAVSLQRTLLEVWSMAAWAATRYELYTWILTMGAIISIGLPEREWFAARVRQALDKLEIRALSNLKTLLQGFLWHPQTNDIDGMEVWRDVQRMRKGIAEHTIHPLVRPDYPVQLYGGGGRGSGDSAASEQ